VTEETTRTLSEDPVPMPRLESSTSRMFVSPRDKLLVEYDVRTPEHVAPLTVVCIKHNRGSGRIQEARALLNSFRSCILWNGVVPNTAGVGQHKNNYCISSVSASSRSSPSLCSSLQLPPFSTFPSAPLPPASSFYLVPLSSHSSWRTINPFQRESVVEFG